MGNNWKEVMVVCKCEVPNGCVKADEVLEAVKNNETQMRFLRRRSGRIF